jgi:hypothetical protein
MYVISGQFYNLGANLPQNFFHFFCIFTLLFQPDFKSVPIKRDRFDETQVCKFQLFAPATWSSVSWINLAWSLIRKLKTNCSLWETLPCHWDVRGHCMCKELPVIPVNKVVDPKRIIWENGELRRRRGTRGRWLPQKVGSIHLKLVLEFISKSKAFE